MTELWALGQEGPECEGEVHARPPTAARCQDGRSPDCVHREAVDAASLISIRDRPRMGARITNPFESQVSNLPVQGAFLPSSLLPGS